MNTAICVTLFEDMGLAVSKNKIVIKLGGGLITDKSQYKVVREDRIHSVCRVISELIEGGKFSNNSSWCRFIRPSRSEKMEFIGRI